MLGECAHCFSQIYTSSSRTGFREGLSSESSSYRSKSIEDGKKRKIILEESLATFHFHNSTNSKSSPQCVSPFYVLRTGKGVEESFLLLSVCRRVSVPGQSPAVHIKPLDSFNGVSFSSFLPG